MSKDYFDNLEYIKQFRKIIVTGAHGAGNKITAKIISEDLGLKYLRCEEPWDSEDYWSPTEGLKKRYENINKLYPNGYVLFSPSQCSHLHRLRHEELKDALIVVVYREMEMIKEYWKRNPFIRNSTHLYESRVRGQIIPEDFPAYKHLLKWEMEEATYELWEKCQKPLMNHWVEIDHKSLNRHPLFIPKERRKDFKSWQTFETQKGHN